MLNSFTRNKSKNKNKSPIKLSPKMTWELIGIVSLSVLVIVGGWLFAMRSPKNITIFSSDSFPNASTPSITSIPVTQSTSTPNLTPEENMDFFYEAVTLANQAYSEGINATSKSQWLGIATKWQKASDFMKQVKPDHPRFKEAQDRIESYQKNSDVAIYKANQSL